MGTIHFSEMIKELDSCKYLESKNTFSMVYMKCDITRGTGGQLVTVERAQKCGLPYHCADNEMRGVVNLESGRKTGFHLRLVFEFNGLIVYW
ncbi:hypothetical protein GM920_09650 [Pedobacter sp. LMG 31462]|uniref:Uncharacterized protein n=2 Tax=Pedobacter gandavensis TaxID=2679963 RepID=A0ABR6EVF4_9SPHI|nr:hypothetical protein [Pedobacter gandavensis]